jgi:crossover junction endodeoxyribonuclease RusA
MTTITLPFPKSVNGTFKRHNGSHLSEAYKAWRDEAGAMLLQQRPKAVPGKVRVEMLLKAPDRRLRDIDNLFKGVLDLLVKHGVIDDDNNRFVRGVSAEWVDEGAPCTVIIRGLQ